MSNLISASPAGEEGSGPRSATTTSMVVSHIGICVSDIDEATRFFTEALGFSLGMGAHAGDEVADIAEVGRPVRMRMQYIEKDDVRFELMEWQSPRPYGSASSSRNHLGLTHICIQVDDLGAIACRLEAQGATVLERTRTTIRTESDVFDAMCVGGPDGIRVELVQRTPSQ